MDITTTSRKRRTLMWLAIATGLAIGAAACGGATVDDDPGQRNAPAATEREQPAADPGPTYPTPKAGDFDLSAKVLEKACFGSAGCNITFRVELAYGGPKLDPAVTYEVTYEVRGGEDPYINTLEVTGDEYSTDQDEFIGTASSGAELKVVVTDVSEY